MNIPNLTKRDLIVFTIAAVIAVGATWGTFTEAAYKPLERESGRDAVEISDLRAQVATLTTAKNEHDGCASRARMLEESVASERRSNRELKERIDTVEVKNEFLRQQLAVSDRSLRDADREINGLRETRDEPNSKGEKQDEARRIELGRLWPALSTPLKQNTEVRGRLLTNKRDTLAAVDTYVFSYDEALESSRQHIVSEINRQDGTAYEGLGGYYNIEASSIVPQIEELQRRVRASAAGLGLQL